MFPVSIRTTKPSPSCRRLSRNLRGPVNPESIRENLAALNARPRRRSPARGRARPWTWPRRRRWTFWSRALDLNENWRACLEEPYRRSRGVRRLVSIKPEIIQRAPADRIRVRVLDKGFRAPSHRVGIRDDRPRSAAISGIAHGAIVCPSGMLRRGMKSYIAHVDWRPQRHVEGLDRAIEVLVIDRVFIVPNPQQMGSSLCKQRRKCHRFPERARSAALSRQSRP